MYYFSILYPVPADLIQNMIWWGKQLPAVFFIVLQLRCMTAGDIWSRHYSYPTAAQCMVFWLNSVASRIFHIVQNKTVSVLTTLSWRHCSVQGRVRWWRWHTGNYARRWGPGLGPGDNVWISPAGTKTRGTQLWLWLWLRAGSGARKLFRPSWSWQWASRGNQNIITPQILFGYDLGWPALIWSPHSSHININVMNFIELSLKCFMFQSWCSSSLFTPNASLI